MKRETLSLLRTRPNYSNSFLSIEAAKDILDSHAAQAAQLRGLKRTLALVVTAWKSHGYCECAECSAARAALEPRRAGRAK